jgi:hypothetical protein
VEVAIKKPHLLTMLRIVCTHDTNCGTFAWDDEAGRFNDDQWDQANLELQRLRNKHGNCFKLLDH